MTKQIRLSSLPIKGIIYDLDGTLVDSNLNFKAMRQTINCPLDQDMLEFIDNIDSPAVKQQAIQMVLDSEHNDAMQSKWLPGGQSLVEHCQQLGLKQAIVTRNNQQAAKLKVQNNHIPSELVISREQYPAKPDPTALLAIAKQWQISPNELVYVGDFKYDVQAANNAKMISVLVHSKNDDSYRHLAQLIFTNLHQLKDAIA